MEPRIQYAQTKDGVSIAGYAMGECGNGQRPGEPTPTGDAPSDGGPSALPWLAAIAGAIAIIGSGSAWFA